MPGRPRAGRPYFVMELVKGVPITEYCDKNNLPTEKRLELFIAVCHAVQHAHQKGDHSPRHQAVERDGHAARRQAGAQGDRLRRRQGDQPAAHREDALHRLRPDDRHAGLHEPRAGRDERPGHRHAQRHLFARRAAVRAAHRHDAVRRQAAARRGLRRDAADHPRGGAAAPQHAGQHAGRQADRRLQPPQHRSRASCGSTCAAIST